MAGLFQVLWGQSDGTFNKAEPLEGMDGQPLTIPVEDEKKNRVERICTRPTAVDWDSDGDLDLVVGNFAGSFYLFIGQGEGKFHPEPEQIKTNGKPLQVHGAHSDPFVVDWDNDGDLDLLSGSSVGGVFWAENTAGKKRLPELKPFQPLIDAPKNMKYGKLLNEGDLVGAGRATRVWADDVDEDGRTDILVGDRVTLIEPAGGISESEFKAKLAQWRQEIAETRAVLHDEDADPNEKKAARKRFSELYRKRRQFMNETRTGFVWLYRQRGS